MVEDGARAVFRLQPKHAGDVCSLRTLESVICGGGCDSAYLSTCDVAVVGGGSVCGVGAWCGQEVARLLRQSKTTTCLGKFARKARPGQTTTNFICGAFRPIGGLEGCRTLDIGKVYMKT